LMKEYVLYLFNGGEMYFNNTSSCPSYLLIIKAINYTTHKELKGDLRCSVIQIPSKPHNYPRLPP
jgi:hypothetical protein